jgi:hypothetical protein
VLPQSGSLPFLGVIPKLGVFTRGRGTSRALTSQKEIHYRLIVGPGLRHSIHCPAKSPVEELIMTWDGEVNEGRRIGALLTESPLGWTVGRSHRLMPLTCCKIANILMLPPRPIMIGRYPRPVPTRHRLC